MGSEFEISGQHVLLGEITAVLTAMRKCSMEILFLVNAEWSFPSIHLSLQSNIFSCLLTPTHVPDSKPACGSNRNKLIDFVMIFTYTFYPNQAASLRSAPPAVILCLPRCLLSSFSRSVGFRGADMLLISPPQMCVFHRFPLWQWLHSWDHRAVTECHHTHMLHITKTIKFF